VIVENKPGASNTLAADATAKSNDGHTMVMGVSTAHAIAPHLLKLPYNNDKDLFPVAFVGAVPNVLVVNNELGPTTVAQLVELAKKQPGKLNYGTAGNGSAGHLAMEYFKSVAKLDIQHVPYKGTGPMLTDLLGGQIEMTFNGIPPIAGQLKAGKIRPIAVGSVARVPSFSDVPTIAESGYPGFETSQWYGIIAPAGVPKPVLDRLHAAIVAALKSPDATQKIVDDGGILVGGSPKDFADLIVKEQARWGTVVRAANIKAE
jgi:tripartite-type tricarboxylate transporter receptor subunit TctC